MRTVWVIRMLWICLLLAAGTSGLHAAESVDGESEQVEEVEPAEFDVKGMGLLGNRQMEKVIRQVRTSQAAPVFNANFVEDAMLIIHNQLVNDGYLDATIVVDMFLNNGSFIHYEWDGKEELVIPRPLAARKATFDARKGVLYYYEDFQLKGLTVLDEDQGKGFFLKTDILLKLKSSRRYSPGRLESSRQNLISELNNLGYQDATATVEQLTTNPATGAVRAVVTVDEGKKHIAQSVMIQRTSEAEAEPMNTGILPTNEPLSILWEQDVSEQINRHFFQQGYPDVRTRIVETNRYESEAGIQLDLVARVSPGKRVQLGEIRHTGHEHTRDSMLRKKTRMQGPYLNRLEVDRARERLARLGIFKFIDVRFEPENAAERDVVFDLTEGRRYNFNLLAGYGSYDQVFGGFEFSHYNLWGIGHNTQLKAVQSIKATYANYTYTIPQFLLSDLNVYASADGLRREELTFDREELKFALGGRKGFGESGHQVGLRYSYEFLRADRDIQSEQDDEYNEAAAIIMDWQLERRDNALLPRDGYRLYTTVEYSEPILGGRAEYSRFEAGGAFHRPISRGGLFLHLGLLHGVVFTPDRDTLLPFNKRFLPGGENSVRGYARGEASPVDATGEQLGAESVLQWNVELEQMLTDTWSVVAFLDGVGTAQFIDDYPFDEVLWSAGGGIRWNTLIGPVRLEYGYNLNPRELDPAGTLHFSVGFPF